MPCVITAGSCCAGECRVVVVDGAFGGPLVAAGRTAVHCRSCRREHHLVAVSSAAVPRMIELSIAPSSIAAEVSRVVTVRIANPDSRAFTNVVVGLDVPAGLGLEQGRSRVELVRLDGGGVYEHVLRVRPLRPGRFTIDVPNLSFRNGYGRAQRERNRCWTSSSSPPTRRPRLRHRATNRYSGGSAPRSSSATGGRHQDDDRSPRPRPRPAQVAAPRRPVPRHPRHHAGHRVAGRPRRGLQSCRLLVAVIGPNWMTPGTGSRGPACTTPTTSSVRRSPSRCGDASRSSPCSSTPRCRTRPIPGGHPGPHAVAGVSLRPERLRHERQRLAKRAAEILG